MKIDRIELFHVATPLSRSFYLPWIPGYSQTVNRLMLLQLTTDEWSARPGGRDTRPPHRASLWAAELGAEAREGLLAEPSAVATGGTVAVPGAPGLGIALDEDKLSRFGERYFETTSRGIAVKMIRDIGS